MSLSLSTLNHYERLSEHLSFMIKRALAVNAEFIKLACHSEVCIEYILTNHMIARATVPLMREALRCTQLLPDDPLSAPLIDYLQQHIIEEADHDEWLIDDLKVLGISREDVNRRMPPPNIAALIGSQYYWMRHHHPIAFVGYLASVETHHPTAEYVEELIKSSGLPAKGFDTIMQHATIDVGHKSSTIEFVNNLPLTEAQFQIIKTSAFQTFRYVALVMEDVCKVAPSNSIRVAKSNN